MPSDFDDILDTLGIGKWNLIYLFGTSIISFMLPGFFFTGAFVTPSVNFTCSNQELEELDIIEDQDQCKFTIWNNSTNGSDITTIKCTEWTYNDEYFPNTLTSEFDMVCDKAYLRPTYQTVLMFGSLLGAPMNGMFSDRFGRKRVLVVTVVISTILVIIQSFINNLELLFILRFFTGFTSTAIYYASYILCMEVCPPKHRSTIGIILSVPWAVGVVWWGVLGYLIRDWKWLMRAYLAPLIIVVPWFWIIDESPRWLIVRGRHDEVVKCLKRAAHWNTVSLSSDDELLKRAEAIEQSLKSETHAKERDKDVSLIRKFGRQLNKILVLYRTPEMRKRISLLNWGNFVEATVYMGLSLNAVNYGLDPFLYMMFGGLSEIPGYTLPIPIIAKFGRIRPMVIFFTICGISIFALAFISYDLKWVLMAFVMIGKFSISASFQIMLLASCELVPTEVRLQGLGTSAFLASSGAMLAPYITDVLSVRKWVPSVVFGVLGMSAGITSSFLPETLNKHMQETVQQVEMDAKRDKNKHTEEEVKTLASNTKVTEKETP